MARASLVNGASHNVSLMSVPLKIQEELLRHLSNFVSDLDKIGGLIEETKPHHALITRWRKLKFEMEGDLNDTLKIINGKNNQKHDDVEAT
jgi:hypothetical protein